MQKLKICCFCETWESGGIESFLNNVLQHINLEKIQVDIVVSCLKKSIFTEPLKQKGIHFFELSGNQRNFLKNYCMFMELLQKENYNAVHLHIFHGLSLYYACLAKKAGVPVRIVHSHNTALRSSKSQQLKLFIHNIAKNLFSNAATDLWACSALAAQFLFSKRALKQKGFQFIPNGIDTEKFRFRPEVRKQMRRRLELENKLIIGNVGRFCYQKNQTFLLDIFAELVKQKPESRLLLVGEGEEEKALRNKAKTLNIAGQVIFYGVSKQIEYLLWAMDMFVFPSHFEGFGIVAIEAQAAGLPVIVSEFIPQEAYITEQVKRLSLQDSAKDWANKIVYTESSIAGREHYADVVQRAGFNILDVTYKIKKYYKDRLAKENDA